MYQPTLMDKQVHVANVAYILANYNNAKLYVLFLLLFTLYASERLGSKIRKLALFVFSAYSDEFTFLTDVH